jgi:hypothetical protein
LFVFSLPGAFAMDVKGSTLETPTVRITVSNRPHTTVERLLGYNNEKTRFIPKPIPGIRSKDSPESTAS